jgi:hypothetical protein
VLVDIRAQMVGSMDAQGNAPKRENRTGKHSQIYSFRTSQDALGVANGKEAGMTTYDEQMSHLLASPLEAAVPGMDLVAGGYKVGPSR